MSDQGHHHHRVSALLQNFSAASSKQSIFVRTVRAAVRRQHLKFFYRCMTTTAANTENKKIKNKNHVYEYLFLPKKQKSAKNKKNAAGCESRGSYYYY